MFAEIFFVSSGYFTANPYRVSRFAEFFSGSRVSPINLVVVVSIILRLSTAATGFSGRSVACRHQPMSEDASNGGVFY